MSIISTQTVAHIADLANIPITSSEEETLAAGFTTTMGVVDQLSTINTTGVEPTHQVTGLENILRDDVVDTDRMFSQKQAIANAKRTHVGYIVVDQLIGQ
ncbi:MAG: Asp-tRNA(Asn)/Glu-tRNA(Gln) amidotransferase subunit GatC [Candidatus Woesebacteria bacterium]